MKENLHVIAITVALFAGGLFTGSWMQKTKPIPPPSMQPWSEFGDGHRGGPPAPNGQPPDRFAPGHEEMRQSMEQKMQELKPKMEAFRSGLEDIEKPFEEKLLGVLNADQKKKYEATHSAAGSQDGPGRPGGMRRGGNPMMDMVLVTPSLETLTQELGLDSKQQAEVKNLLVSRRSQFLALVDKNPPPTFEMGRMARQGFGGGPMDPQMQGGGQRRGPPPPAGSFGGGQGQGPGFGFGPGQGPGQGQGQGPWQGQGQGPGQRQGQGSGQQREPGPGAGFGPGGPPPDLRGQDPGGPGGGPGMQPPPGDPFDEL